MAKPEVKISIVGDASKLNKATTDASMSLSKLRSGVGDADGFFGKLRAGGAGLSTMLSEHITSAATAAGAALVAFGVKSVMAFQDAALSAGKFADATGLAVDDASRWIEVAGDVGISAETIQSSFQKFNKAVADGKPALEQYGVTIARAANGTVDANQTFINAADAIGKIKDPTLRAKAAQELFGKSYGEISELIEMGAKDVQTALASVSDAKVIDEGELEKARRLRAAMDELKDAADDVSLALGEALVPVVTEVAEGTSALGDVFKNAGIDADDWSAAIRNAIIPNIEMGNAIEDLAKDVLNLGDETEQLGAKLGATNDQLSFGEIAAQEYEDAVAAAENESAVMKVTTDALREAVRRLDEKWQKLTGGFSDEAAFLDLQDSFDDLKAAALEAWVAASDGADDAAQKQRDYRQGQLGLIDTTAQYLREVLKIPPEVATEILADIDRGSLNEAELKIQQFIQRQREIRIPVTTTARGRGGAGNGMAFTSGQATAGAPTDAERARADRQAAGLDAIDAGLGRESARLGFLRAEQQLGESWATGDQTTIQGAELGAVQAALRMADEAAKEFEANSAMRGGTASTADLIRVQMATLMDLLGRGHLANTPAAARLQEIIGSLGQIPFLAEGGVVSRPTLAMIGEGGPEAVVPLGQLGRGGGISITVNAGMGANGAVIGQQIVEEIKRYERTHGRVFQAAS